MSWQTPEDYNDDRWHNSCDYDTRLENGCTEIFLNNGLLKDLAWDHYAEYDLLCKNCPHYCHNIGVYFGEGHSTDRIQEKDTVWCWCRISNHEEFLQAISFFPKNLKAVFFSDIRTESLAELKRFANLECVLLEYCPKLIHFWEFTKTPKLKVLEYVTNTHLTDLTELSHAESLAYLGINTLVSNVNLTYVNSFAPLRELANLKELSLSSVMCADNNIDDLIAIPNMEKLWISPHTFSTKDFAKFEAKRFKIYEEYGIYQNGDDYIRPLGKGGRRFRSTEAKERFSKEYHRMMQKYIG